MIWIQVRDVYAEHARLAAASCTVRTSCTDETGHRTDGTRCTEIIRPAVPRPETARSQGPRSRGGEDRAPAAQGGGLSVPHYPKAAPRRAWVIGACELALCYPMWPRAKPPIPAVLAAAPPGQHCSWQARRLHALVRGAGLRVVDRGDTQPQPRSIPPTVLAGDRIRRPDGSGGIRKLTTRANLQARQNDLI